jgi:hypothetical protein
VLHGLDGFVVLGHAELDGELELPIETTADLVGCPACGTVARAKDRRPSWVRDLPLVGGVGNLDRVVPRLAAGGGGDAAGGLHPLDEGRLDELVAVRAGRRGLGGQQQPRGSTNWNGCRVNPTGLRTV